MSITFRSTSVLLSVCFIFFFVCFVCFLVLWCVICVLGKLPEIKLDDDDVMRCSRSTWPGSDSGCKYATLTTPCRLRGCKNRPAQFPGRMS